MSTPCLWYSLVPRFILPMAHVFLFSCVIVDARSYHFVLAPGAHEASLTDPDHLVAHTHTRTHKTHNSTPQQSLYGVPPG